jgi:hypothetical protein
VNEALEGWGPSNFEGSFAHIHSISTAGATDGTHSLQLDRTNTLDEQGNHITDFTWGSAVTYVADINPDPMVEEIDPVIQARITDIIQKLEGGESIAFDVHYEHQDLFPASEPSYLKFSIAITDETGVFYQFHPEEYISLTGVTELDTTIEYPLDEFVDANTGTLNLKTDGLVDDSGFLRIALATSTDGEQFYQIDNLRIISLAPEGLLGDFNEDGKVDTADYIKWRKSGSTSLPNDDGVATAAERYNLWMANYGQMAPGGGSLAAVPEPASMVLLVAAAIVGSFIRTRRG